MADVLAVLERARKFELEINSQIEHIERVKRIAARARESTEYSVKIVEKLAKLERELNEQIDITVDAKLEALEYVSYLTGEERGVIESYYILAKNWEQIADKMYMSDRRVFLIRKSALAKLREKYENTESRRDYGNRSKYSQTSGACGIHTGTTCTENRCNGSCGG